MHEFVAPAIKAVNLGLADDSKHRVRTLRTPRRTQRLLTLTLWKTSCRPSDSSGYSLKVTSSCTAGQVTGMGSRRGMGSRQAACCGSQRSLHRQAMQGQMQLACSLPCVI